MKTLIKDGKVIGKVTFTGKVLAKEEALTGMAQQKVGRPPGGSAMLRIWCSEFNIKIVESLAAEHGLKAGQVVDNIISDWLLGTEVFKSTYRS